MEKVTFIHLNISPKDEEKVKQDPNIQKIIDDTQQFVTLELTEANYGVRYVQASVNYGKISVELGLEEGDNIKLVEKVCSKEECQRIFLDFFDYGYVNEMEKYTPVQFFV